VRTRCIQGDLTIRVRLRKSPWPGWIPGTGREESILLTMAITFNFRSLLRYIPEDGARRHHRGKGFPEAGHDWKHGAGPMTPFPKKGMECPMDAQGIRMTGKLRQAPALGRDRGGSSARGRSNPWFTDGAGPEYSPGPLERSSLGAIPFRAAHRSDPATAVPARSLPIHHGILRISGGGCTTEVRFVHNFPSQPPFRSMTFFESGPGLRTSQPQMFP
jgi:hypothetical protein